jgi:hypothetical protein
MTTDINQIDEKNVCLDEDLAEVTEKLNQQTTENIENAKNAQFMFRLMTGLFAAAIFFVILAEKLKH